MIVFGVEVDSDTVESENGENFRALGIVVREVTAVLRDMWLNITALAINHVLFY